MKNKKLNNIITKGAILGTVPWLIVFLLSAVAYNFKLELMVGFFIQFFFPIISISLTIGILTAFGYYNIRKKHRRLANIIISVILILYIICIIIAFLAFFFFSWLTYIGINGGNL